MKPKMIDGQWRVVHDGHVQWKKDRGLADKPCTDTVFDSLDDALAYIDKFEDGRGML